MVPLSLVRGWNHVCLDLEAMASKAFGCTLASVRRVIVHARCRVWHVFLHNRVVLDPELPDSVRVVP